MERRATRRATAGADTPKGQESRTNEAECGMRPRFFPNLSGAPLPLLAYVMSRVAEKPLLKGYHPSLASSCHTFSAGWVGTAHAVGPALPWGGPFKLSCPRTVLCGSSTKNYFLTIAGRKLQDPDIYGGAQMSSGASRRVASTAPAPDGPRARVMPKHEEKIK